MSTEYDVKMKKAHQYKLTLEYLENQNGENLDVPSFVLRFENHDDIFSIIKRMQERHFFDSETEDAEFAIGLKLFSEVMLRHRNHPLFDEMQIAMGAFMKKLKSQ